MDVLANLGDRVGEGPLWSAAENALWWVDIDGYRLHRCDWATRETRTWETPERFSALALLHRNELLAAGELSLFHVCFKEDGSATFKPTVKVEHPYTDMRFNDGRTDRAGTFFISSLQRDRSGCLPSGSVYWLEGQRLCGPIVGGLITANGMAFSPDNRTMYLCDSHVTVQRIWSFDRSDDGRLLSRREFVDMTAFEGRPDGATVDADGCYWVCATDAGKILRFDPRGRLDRSISLPVLKPTMCTFAGPDLDCLVITSMRSRDPEHVEPGLDGAVFVTRPGVRGLAETPCREGTIG